MRTRNKIILGIVALLILWGGAYFFFQDWCVACWDQTTTKTNTTTSSSTTSSSVAQEQKIYLDVREDDERAAGHVQGAMHIKMGEILAWSYSQIPTDEPVYVYCRSGRRAGEVISYLKTKGYTNVINAGGMSELQDVQIVR